MDSKVQTYYFGEHLYLLLESSPAVINLFTKFDKIIRNGRRNFIRYDVDNILKIIKKTHEKIPGCSLDVDNSNVGTCLKTLNLDSIGVKWGNLKFNIFIGPMCKECYETINTLIIHEIDNRKSKWSDICMLTLEERCQYVIRQHKEKILNQMMIMCGLKKEQLPAINDMLDRTTLLK